MYRQVIILSGILCLAVDAKIEIPTSLEPESSLIPMLADDCAKPISQGDKSLPGNIDECLNSITSGPEGKTVIDDLPKRLVDWGSGGAGGRPWLFSSQVCNEFFISLLQRIAEDVPDIILSPHDLFHAHLITYGENLSTKPRLAIVFHAKEYPSDLERVKNNYQRPPESFSSKDKAFKTRNFIYINYVGGQTIHINDQPKTLVNDIYAVNDQGYCHQYFSSISANTLSEKSLAKDLHNAKLWGDVNIFLPDTIGRIKYQFYPGFAPLGSNYLEDLEGYETGKLPEIRRLANYGFDHFLKNQGQKPIIYFLTGL